MTNGIKIVFGDAECPQLPAGFRLVRRRLASALAVREEKEYLICLEPNRLVPVLRREDHTIHADFENAIAF